jgi:hypothetical protein
MRREATDEKHPDVAHYSDVSQLHIADHDSAHAGEREQPAGDHQNADPCRHATPPEERGSDYIESGKKMSQPRMSQRVRH